MQGLPAKTVSRSVRDGDWELLSWDPVSGRTVWASEDSNGNTVVRTDYPVQSILDKNAEMMSNSTKGFQGDWHHVASVPLNLVHDQTANLNEAFRQGDDKHISRWLNDSDNAKWRTKGGRL